MPPLPVNRPRYWMSPPNISSRGRVAYMREIRYPGYLVHKRLHDRMKRETLPALEEALYSWRST
mgnify:CR=1 FL=1